MDDQSAQAWLAEGIIPLWQQLAIEYGDAFMRQVVEDYGFAIFRISDDHRREVLNSLSVRMLT